MLTLNQTTLYYWNISNPSKKPKFDSKLVGQWARTIPNNAKADHGVSSKRSSGTGRSATPSLTNQSTATGSSVPTSVQTDDNRPRPRPRIIIKPEPEDDYAIGENDDGTLFAQDDGGISDRDERIGEEHEDAMKSPPKGSGVRLGSEVSLTVYLFSLLTYAL